MDCRVTRATVLTWPAATVTVGAVAGHDPAPDPWSKYRPGAEPLTCSEYVPGRTEAMVYLPSGSVIAIARPAGPDTATHAPASGAPPVP